MKKPATAGFVYSDTLTSLTGYLYRTDTINLQQRAVPLRSAGNHLLRLRAFSAVDHLEFDTISFIKVAISISLYG